MKNIIKTTVLVTLIFTSSCATIISGSRQVVKINSNPKSAKVYINEVEVGTTPLEKNLKRNQEYNILIKLDGYQPYETLLEKKFNAWYLGNILIGGVIGLVVDPITGAMYKLSPEELNANLEDKMVFTTKGKDIYVTVSLDIDPEWEKVGQLDKQF